MPDARRSQWDIIIFLSGVSAVVFLDRLTKNFFSGFLDLNESIAVIRNVLHFTLVHNTGIAFGFFKDCGMVFIIVPVILTGLLIYNVCYYRHSPQLSRTYIVAFSLILGGAIGNLIDRIFLGYVIDFRFSHLAGLQCGGQRDHYRRGHYSVKMYPGIEVGWEFNYASDTFYNRPCHYS